MRKKLIISISIAISALLLTIISVFAYYQTRQSGWQQTYEIQSMNFSVNGVYSDNSGSTNTQHDVKISDLTFNKNNYINMQLSVLGTTNGSVAVAYDIDIDSSTKDPLYKAIEVFLVDGDKKSYVSDLYTFASEGLSGYLGLNETKNIKLYFALSPNASKLYADKSVSLSFLATYDVIANSAKQKVTYFYVSNTLNETGSSLKPFDILQKNIDSIENTTIVLLDDMSFENNVSKDIVFTKKVGLDLNGHTLDLAGGSITISSDDNTPSNVFIGDSKGSGKIINAKQYTSSIEVDLPNDYIGILDESENSDLMDQIKIASFSPEQIANKIKDNLDEISTKPLVNVDNDSALLDATKNLKYYISKNLISITTNSQNITPYFDLYSAGQYLVNRQDTNYFYDLSFTISSKNPSYNEQINHSLNIQGNSAYSLAQSIFNSFDNTINGSLYFPVYDYLSGASYTFVSSNQNLISNDGTFLKNGYSVLDTFKNKKITLSLLVTINGQTSIFTREFNVSIMSDAQKLELFYNFLEFKGTTLDDAFTTNISSTITSNFKSTSEALSYYKNNYGLEASSIDELTSLLVEKLGIKSIEINEDSTDLGDNTYGIDLDVNKNGPSYFVVSHKFSEAYDYYTLSINSIPKDSSINFNISDKITFYSNDFDNAQKEVEKTRTISVISQTSTKKIYDPIGALQEYFTNYENSMKYDTDTNLYPKYINKFEVMSYTTQNTMVNYIIPDEYKDFIEVVRDYNGQVIQKAGQDTPDEYDDQYQLIDGADTSLIHTYIRIKEGMTPPTNTFINVTATIEDSYYDATSPKAGSLIEYALNTKISGILINDRDILDSFLYYALLDVCDTNNDLWITYDEAQEVSNLNLSNKQIENINGLSYFKALETLNLSNNKIVDISPLQGLNNLYRLELRSNNIAALDALSLMDNLTYLDLDDNLITDLSPIRFLTGINTLRLHSYNQGRNEIKDFEPLKDYNSITYLDVTCGDASLNTSRFYFALVDYNSRQNGKYPTIIQGSTLSFTDSERVSVSVISKVLVTAETYNTLYLPAQYSYNGNVYSLVWSNPNLTNPLITNIHLNSGATSYSYNITSPYVDRDVALNLNVSGYSSTLKINLKLLHLPQTSVTIQLTENGPYQDFASVVLDNALRAELLSSFDADGNHNISYEELTATPSSSLVYKSLGILSLEGIEHFTGIKDLDLRDNKIEDLTSLAKLPNLEKLHISSLDFDYTELLNIVSNTPTAVAPLRYLYLAGCYNLGSGENQTELYKVYKYFDNINIYLENEYTVWDPFAANIISYAGQLPQEFSVKYLGDEIVIPKKFSALFYGVDNLTFSISDLGYSNLNSWQVTGKYNNYFLRDNSSELAADNYCFKYNSLVSSNQTMLLQLTLQNPTIEGETYPVAYKSYNVYVKIMLNYIGDKYTLDFSNYKQNLYDSHYDTRDYKTLRTLDEAFPNDLLRTLFISNITSEDPYVLSADRTSQLISAASSSYAGNTWNAFSLINRSNDNKTLEGLRYFKDITYLKFDYDSSFGSGADLISITNLEIYNSNIDMSTLNKDEILKAAIEVYGEDYIDIYYSDTLAVGKLPITKLVMQDNYSHKLYDKEAYDNSSTVDVNDTNIFYLAHMPKITYFSCILTTSNRPNIYDFTFLKPYTTGSDISYLSLRGYEGSIYKASKAILEDIYNNSTATDKTFYICGSEGRASSSQVFEPESKAFTYKAEYDDLAQYIVDAGLRINGGNLYYEYNDPVAASDITLPAYINTLEAIRNSQSGDDENVSEEARRWQIVWYICGPNAMQSSDVTDLLSAKGFSIGAKIDIQNDSGSDVGNKYPVLINGSNHFLEDKTIKISRPTYDKYFYIEGEIGTYINNEVVSCEPYKYVYPMMIYGRRTPDSTGKYSINGNTYESYRVFEDPSTRFTTFCGLEFYPDNHSKSTAPTDYFGLMLYDNGTRGTSHIKHYEAFGGRPQVQVCDSGSITSDALQAIFGTSNGDRRYSGYTYLTGSLTSLSGINYVFPNLTVIRITNTKLADIEFVKYYNNLTFLDVSKNAIRDISPVQGKTTIQKLYIYSNDIKTTYYQSGNYYISYFKGMDLKYLYEYANSSLTYVDVLTLCGDVRVSSLDNDEIIKYAINNNTFSSNDLINRRTSMPLKTINYSNSLADMDFRSFVAVKYLYSISTASSFDFYYDTSSSTDLINNFESVYSDMLLAYNLSTTPHKFDSTSYIINGSTPSLFNYRIGSVDSNTGTILLSDSDNMKYFKGVFNLSMKYRFSNIYMIFDMPGYNEQASESNDNYLYVLYDVTDNDINNMSFQTLFETKSYKENGVKVNAFDLFDENMALYFITNAHRTYNYSDLKSWPKYFIYNEGSNFCLVFKDDFTGSDFQFSGGYNVKSLKGLEIFNFRTIEIKNNPIIELPNFNSSNTSQIDEFCIYQGNNNDSNDSSAHNKSRSTMSNPTVLNNTEMQKLGYLTNVHKLILEEVDMDLTSTLNYNGVYCSYLEYLTYKMPNLDYLVINLGSQLYQYDSNNKLLYNETLNIMNNFIGQVDPKDNTLFGMSASSSLGQAKTMDDFKEYLDISSYHGARTYTSSPIIDTPKNVISLIHLDITFYNGSGARVFYCDTSYNRTFAAAYNFLNANIYYSYFTGMDKTSGSSRILEYNPLDCGSTTTTISFPYKMRFMGFEDTFSRIRYRTNLISATYDITSTNGSVTGDFSSPDINRFRVYYNLPYISVNYAFDKLTPEVIGVEDRLFDNLYVQTSQSTFEKASDVFASLNLIYYLYNISGFTSLDNTKPNTYNIDGKDIDKLRVLSTLDMQSVTTFRINSYDITSYKGMQYFTNIQDLEINTFCDTDLSSFSNLVLTTFKLDYMSQYNYNFNLDFLENSKDTLTTISLTSSSDNSSMYMDLTNLLEFKNLVNINVKDFYNSTNLSNLKYLNAYYTLYRPDVNFRFNGGTMTQDVGYLTAAQIFASYDTSSIENSFSYDGLAVISPDTQLVSTDVYYLPATINYAGILKKVEYKSLSSYVKIDGLNEAGEVSTVLEDIVRYRVSFVSVEDSLNKYFIINMSVINGQSIGDIYYSRNILIENI